MNVQHRTSNIEHRMKDWEIPLRAEATRLQKRVTQDAVGEICAEFLLQAQRSQGEEHLQAGSVRYFADAEDGIPPEDTCKLEACVTLEDIGVFE